MTKLLRAGLAALSLILASPSAVLAHGGEDHGAPSPSAVSSASVPVPAVPGGFATEGETVQAVLYPDGDHSLLYLADVATNAPVAGAAVDVEAGGWRGRARPDPAAGVYHLDWAVPSHAQAVDVTLVVTAAGRDDLLLLTGIGLPPAAAARPEPAIAHWTHWTGGGAIGAVVVAALLLSRRRRPDGIAALAALAILLPAGPTLAHGGEDHGEPAAAAIPVPARPGQPVAMPKPTQFLLGIRTITVQSREAAETVRVVGRVIADPAGHARIQPSQPARVVSDPAYPIPVPGQTVRRGQVLAVLEPTLSTLEKGDKRALLSRVDGEIAITEREMGRQTALGDLIPAKQLETTRIRLDQLRKERGQITGTSLGRELLIAPVDGVVTDVHVIPGEVAAADRVLVEIVDPGRLRVEAVIHDLAVARRISGATAASRLVPDQSFPLDLLGVSPKVDPLDQGVHAIFRVAPAQAAALTIGMPLDVFVATGATSLRTAVPRDSIAEVGGRQVVFVRAAPELFEVRPIVIERIVGPLAEISDGIRSGDRVVVQGISQLKAGR